MTRQHPSWLVGIAVLATSAAACGGGAAYRVTELGPLPAVGMYSSYAAAINNHNQVAGYVREGERGPVHAVLWERDGRAVELTLGYAADVNDAGVVVGSGMVGGLRAFQWSGGRLSALAVPGATLSEAYAIGADGHVVGRYDVAGATLTSRIFLWNNGVTRDLGAFHPGTGAAFAVEKHGQVVGARLADPANPRSPN
ncbi:MAG TPA: hypothetical protein VF705_03970, partial [Longimicrobium sp.]